MELTPDRCPDERCHRNTDASATIRHWLSGSQLEPEPVSDIARGCLAQLSLGDLTCELAVNVDIDGSSDADTASNQCCSTLDDPVIIDQVQSLKESIVRELALELGKGPDSALCQRTQSVC